MYPPYLPIRQMLLERNTLVSFLVRQSVGNKQDTDELLHKNSYLTTKELRFCWWGDSYVKPRPFNNKLVLASYNMDVDKLHIASDSKGVFKEKNGCWKAQVQ